MRVEVYKNAALLYRVCLSKKKRKIRSIETYFSNIFAIVICSGKIKI